MRLLFAIPHYYSAGTGLYGSERSDPRPRIEALRATLLTLHQTFGPQQSTLGHNGARANGALAASLDIVVCSTAEEHVLRSVPPTLFEHRVCSGNPRLLGYHCHGVLAERLGQYDYYCFVEDDILIADALFFCKLAWFAQAAGQQTLLQPNRFEISVDGPVRKLYIDGPLKAGLVNPALTNRSGRPSLSGRIMGQHIHFERADNPHSGCFFLSASQMRHWTDQPYFLDESADFVGPLESAASLGIIRSFEIYKPAASNAAFLEVQHHDRRFLGGLAKFPPGFQVR